MVDGSGKLLLFLAFLSAVHFVNCEYIVFHTNRQTKTILRINRDDAAVSYLDENNDFLDLPVFNFSIPKNDPHPCIRMESSFYFVANYSMLLMVSRAFFRE
jgi:hypothetical protein